MRQNHLLQTPCGRLTLSRDSTGDREIARCRFCNWKTEHPKAFRMRAHAALCEHVPAEAKERLARNQEEKDQRAALRREAHADADGVMGGSGSQGGTPNALKKPKRAHDGTPGSGAQAAYKCVSLFDVGPRFLARAARNRRSRGDDGDLGPPSRVRGKRADLPPLASVPCSPLLDRGCRLPRLCDRRSPVTVRSSPRRPGSSPRHAVHPPTPLSRELVLRACTTCTYAVVYCRSTRLDVGQAGAGDADTPRPAEYDRLCPAGPGVSLRASRSRLYRQKS